MVSPTAETSSSASRRPWDRPAIGRFVWTIVSIFVVESVVFGASVLPAVLFFRWHLGWTIESDILRITALTMVLVPAYAIFALLMMALSAMSTKVLGWRPLPHLEMRIDELGWPLCNWARYQISSYVVGFFAGGLLRATPLWSMYMRWNGASLGKRVWVNSLGVTDHCLLEFGDDVVIGSGVHLSGHTVERGVVLTAPVRIGAGSTIGVNAHVEIGADIGPHCQIGSLSMVPKHTVLDLPGTYVGVPVHRLTDASRAAECDEPN